ncbi:MAG TPA: hypothetical protein DEP72_06145 [Clostridiales bacterium]|nr:MAG: hypothetical protein A2Y18_01560 [Clostridiales bacterium GWD2_32_19]HCC07720.1 hypothetical protein [Clostridiales bacterium]
MNKLINFGAWMIAGFIISWAFQHSIEQEEAKNIQPDIISSIISNEETVKALIGEDGPKTILTKDKLEVNLKNGDGFAISLNESNPDLKWMYEVDDEQAFQVMSYDVLNSDTTTHIWPFKAIMKGEHYLYYKLYNKKTNEQVKDSELNFKININD